MFTGLLSTCIIADFAESLASDSKRPIKNVSLNNQPYKATLTIVNINSNQNYKFSFFSIYCQC